MVRAWERATELIAQARRNRRACQATRASRRRQADSVGVPTPVRAANHNTVWTADDGLIRCDVIPHSPDDHEVIVLVDGAVVSSRSFADPVEATDDSWRARRLLLG